MATSLRIQATITVQKYDDPCRKCKSRQMMFETSLRTHPVWVGDPEHGGEFYQSTAEAEKAIIKMIKKHLSDFK